MARSRSKDQSGGMPIGARFALNMTIALSVVMVLFGTLLFSTVKRLVSIEQKTHMAETARAVELMAKSQDTAQRERVADDGTRTLEKVTRLKYDMEQLGTEGLRIEGGSVLRAPVRYGKDKSLSGHIYRFEDTSLLMPEVKSGADGGIFGLIFGSTLAVILVGAIVAFLVGGQVSRPLDVLVEDVRQIARGNLHHRTRVRKGGEVGVLARTIDRMSTNLAEAQDAELELSIRDRESEVAAEVRESLMPLATPSVPGFEVSGRLVASPSPGGDFYDFQTAPGGRTTALVCEVSGLGTPGAIVGATARSYLRSELGRGEDIATCLKRVNRMLAPDLRRGMYVTAMLVTVDPADGAISLASTGHKMPAIRCCGADGKIRVVHPEGIALGMDSGEIFDSRLDVVHISMEPGDRLVIANTAAVRVASEEGEELGEKGFYRDVLRHAAKPSEEFLDALQASLEEFAGETPFPADVAVVTLTRIS